MFGKKSNLSKVQKEREKDRKRKEDDINKKVKDELWPVLAEISTNTFDAKVLLQVLKTVIQQALLNKQTKMFLSDLELTNLLKNDDNDQWKKYDKLILTLNGELIGDVYQILDGLTSEIELREKIILKDYKLNDLLCSK